MAINNNDDYDKLAKILYPSIEASGNVYYGQTRKLTMDEILGKNELNFESHIETFKQGDETYKSYFNWKLGPLHGAIQVESLDSNGEITLKNFPGQLQFNLFKYCDSYSSYIDDPDKDIHGTVFAKYILVKQSTPIPNIIQSASFTTYETTFSAELSGLYVADSNIIVIDNNTWFLFNDNRNFFITHEDYNDCLYVKIASRKHKSLYKDYIDKPFRITNLHNANIVVYLYTDAGLHSINDRFKYNKNNEGWIDCDENDDTTITIKKGDYVELKITADAVDNKALKIVFGEQGPFSISGNLFSLYYTDFATKDYESVYMNSDFFSQMFKGAHTLTDASRLSIPCQLGYGASFSQMFYDCTNLVYPPELPSISVADNCYEYMFYGCSSLKYVPDLSHILELQSNCFYGMFEDCTALEYPQDVLPAVSLPYRCYYYMYSGCTSLKRTPLILCTSTSSNQCLLYMFDGCTSLKMACIALQTLGLTSAYWLRNVSESGTLFVTTNFDEVASANRIPQGWDIIRNDFSKLTVYNLYNGYYCDKYAYNEPYAKSILSVSGSDCDTNGRGKIENQTKFNMLDISPVISGNINYTEYDANSGALNQEVWGYKCFNSPVSFRNGIYGECSSLITSNPNCDSLNIRLSDNNDIIDSLEPAYSLGAKFICAVPDGYLNSPLSQYNPCSTIEIYHSSIKEDHYNNDTDGNYKACVSQAGIIASNKYSDISNSNRYIDVNAASGSDYESLHSSAVITSASVCPVANMSTEVVGYLEEYKSSIVAGSAYLKIKYTDNPGISDSIIELYANEISLDGSVTCYSPVHIDDTLDVLGNIYTSSSLIVPLVSDDIDPVDGEAEKDCLVLGNTRNNNSGALVVKTEYGYDVELPIDETIPLTASVTLSCTLNDINGDSQSYASIDFNVYQDHSIIYINSEQCNLPTTDIAGDLTVRDGVITGIVDSLYKSEDNRISVGAIAFIYYSFQDVTIGQSLKHGDIINITADSGLGYVDRIGDGTQAVFLFYFAQSNASGFTYAIQDSISLKRDDRYALLCGTERYNSGPCFLAIVMRIQ